MTRSSLLIALATLLCAVDASASCPTLYAAQDCTVGTYYAQDVCTFSAGIWDCRLTTEGTEEAFIAMVNDFDGAGETIYSAWGKQPNGDLFCCTRTSTTSTPLCEAHLHGHYENDGDDLLTFQWGDDTLGSNSQCDDGIPQTVDFVAKALGHGGEDLIVGSYDATSGYQERLRGMDDDDKIRGDDGDDIIEGEGGDDILCGEGDNDDLDGGPGDDDLFGGAGTGDWNNGGSGNDGCASPHHTHSQSAFCQSTPTGGCPF